MTLTLQQLDATDQPGFTSLLDGLYEHSPWIAERTWHARPFGTLAALRQALITTVREAGREAGLSLIRAHPELAGKAMEAGTLTAESTQEQGRAGLTACTPEELAEIRRLNAAYQAKFGFPFVVAVRGPRGQGLSKGEILATFRRRLENPPGFEFDEALRNIHRIAELRLDDKFDCTPAAGDQILAWADALAIDSDPPFAQRGELSVTYLTDAHRAVAARLTAWMREDCGFDEVHIDAVGNVVGVYHGSIDGSRRLLTGSHYDTVRNGGRYDGRLGILVPMLCVQTLHRAGRRLPFGIEVIGFAEEEGQRYKAVFLGSGALTGDFDPAWLEQADADGITMREAMRHAGLDPAAIPALAREPSRYLGFVEVHIEQGPVLNALDLPLGVVTSINGSVRHVGEFLGMASHAGTTPMNGRRDAAVAAAEFVLDVERRAREAPDLVGTVGVLEVPDGSINVVPGHCRFSLDIRATTDAVRDACLADVLTGLEALAERRGVQYRIEETMRAAAAPCDPAWQARWARAVSALGLPVHRLPSGAGHDAMKLHTRMPQAMLFVRGQNAGISHNPLESVTQHDAGLSVQAFQNLLEQLATEGP